MFVFLIVIHYYILRKTKQPKNKTGSNYFTFLQATVIEVGLDYMIEHESKMRDLEPDNGWGSYEGALEYLQRIRSMCIEHPAGTLCVNW